MRYVIKQLQHDIKMYDNFQSLNHMSDEFIKMINKICDELECNKAIFYKDHINYIRDMLSKSILNSLITEENNQTNSKSFDTIKSMYDNALEEVAISADIIKKANYSDNMKRLANFNISGVYLNSIIYTNDNAELIFDNIYLKFNSVTKLDIKNYKEVDIIGKSPVKVLYEELFLNENNTFEYNILFDEGELSIVFANMQFN